MEFGLMVIIFAFLYGACLIVGIHDLRQKEWTDAFISDIDISVFCNQ